MTTTEFMEKIKANNVDIIATACVNLRGEERNATLYFDNFMLHVVTFINNAYHFNNTFFSQAEAQDYFERFITYKF